jgi:hypothetical protein
MDEILKFERELLMKQKRIEYWMDNKRVPDPWDIAAEVDMALPGEA